MSPLKHSNNLAARMGRWSANHWKTAVFGWVAFVVASVVIGGQVGTKYLETDDLAVGEAATATEIIESGFPQRGRRAGRDRPDPVEDAHGRRSGLQGRDRGRRQDGRAASRRCGSSTRRSTPVTPISSRRPSLGDGPVPAPSRRPTRKRSRTSTSSRPQSTRPPPKHPGFEVNQLGSVTTTKATDAAFNNMLKTAGLIAIPLTLVILLFVFGSAVAALIPLLLAITAVMATTALIALPSQFIAVDEQIAEVILLIGLAVGIDYSLFYLRREREERAAGRSEHAALEAAAATSGRAVLISGVTVLIAMAGMFLSGDKTFMSFSIGTMMVVAVAMIGSLTVLPALLGRLGDKVEKGRDPVPGPAPQQERRESLLGRDPRSCPPPPGRLGCRSRRRPGRAGRARAVAEHGHHGRRRHLDPGDRAAEEVRRGLPGRQRPGRHRDPGRRRPHTGDPGRDRRAEAGSARIRPDERPDRARGQPRQHRRQPRSRSRERAPTTSHRPLSPRCATTLLPQHARRGRGRRVRRHRHDRPGQGLGVQHGDHRAARLRLRAPVRLPDHARSVPLDRRRPEGDPAQPPLRRSGVRHPRRRSSSGAGARACSASSRTAASRPGCRCSCS